MIEPSQARPKAVRFAAPLRAAARAAFVGLLAAGVVAFVGHGLLGAQRAEVRLLMLQPEAGDVDAAADAAVRLAASPTFLRAALRHLPAASSERITPGLLPSRPLDRLRSLFDLSVAETPEERAVAALGRALTVERVSTGPVLSVAVTARDGRLAAATAGAVAAAYARADAGADDPRTAGARVMGEPSIGRIGATGTGLAALIAGLAAAAATGVLAFLRLRRRQRKAATREPAAPPVAGSVPVDVRLAPERLAETVAGIWRAAARDLEPARCLVVTGAGDGDRARVACGLLANATPVDDAPTVIVDLVARPADDTTPGGHGFSDLLDGAASFAEVIQRGRGQHVHVIDGTAASLVLEPPVRRERFAAVIEALVLTYDHVVVHADPIADESVFAALAAHADGYVLAVDRSGCGREVRAAHAAIAARARVPVTVVSVEGITVPRAARPAAVAEAA